MLRVWVVFFLVGTVACTSTPPVKPEADKVEVSREPADEDCKEIGPVEGRNSSAKGTFDMALTDLKADAASRGANYVQIRKSGAMGTATRGIAYLCL
jgi:hypothetical protein